MKNSDNKTEKFNQIFSVLVEYDLRLKYLADDIYNLEITNKEKVNEINILCGDFETIKDYNKRDRRECIETSIVYFKDHDLYIKEVGVGECHYSDLCIDGAPYRLNYELVEPQVKTIIDFV